MTNLQKRVKHFMSSVGQPTPDKPTIPDNLTRVLRVSLILEEALEFAKASGIEISLKDDIKSISINDLNYNIVGEPDIVGVCDGICDLNVVSVGAAISYGVDIEPLENEVCDSNDSKIENGYRRDDGKWVKNPNYRKANLEPLIRKQMKNDYKGEF